MTNSGEELEAALHTYKLSLTKPRQVVFDALQRHEAITMVALIDLCTNEIDRASVYRTVALFEQIGIVQRVQVGWKYLIELSDQFNPHHHHATCNSCGSLIPLAEDDELEGHLDRIAAIHRFQPTMHHLEIHGLCEACQ